MLREHQGHFFRTCTHLIGWPICAATNARSASTRRSVRVILRRSALTPRRTKFGCPLESGRATRTFAVIVRGNSMEPMVSDGDVAVFSRRANRRQRSVRRGGARRADAAQALCPSAQGPRPAGKPQRLPTRRSLGTRTPASRACSRAGSTRRRRLRSRTWRQPSRALLALGLP